MPTVYLHGNNLPCPACSGPSPGTPDPRCDQCRGLGLVAKPPSQIVQETLTAHRALSEP